MAKVEVPDGLQGWQLNAARCAAQWSTRDLAAAAQTTLDTLHRLDNLDEWIISRGARGRRYAGEVEEDLAERLLAAFASVGLELRPKGRHPAAVICVDPDKLAKRRAQEAKGRAKARAEKSE